MSARPVLTLPRLPPMLPGLIRAALRRGRGSGLPAVALRVGSVRAEPRRLATYRTLVGLPADGVLPLPHPQVLAAPLHVALMARPDFSHSALGVVHVRNLIVRVAHVPEDAAFALVAWFEAEREVPAGLELDLVTELELAGRVAWRATTTMLRRNGRTRSAGRPAREEADRFAGVPSTRWVVPADTGRRYARVSGDVNPIHLHALTARPFGYRRAIAHGLWTLARSVAELGEAAAAPAVRLACRFQRPLFLGSEVRFQALATGEATEFRVSSSDGTPHLSGRLEAGDS